MTVFQTGTTHVVYFIANKPFSYNEDFNVSAQSSGLQRVQLLKPDIRSPHFPSDTWTFDVTAPSVSQQLSSILFFFCLFLSFIQTLRKSRADNVAGLFVS